VIPTLLEPVLAALPGITVTPDLSVSVQSSTTESTGPHTPSDAFLQETGAGLLAAQADLHSLGITRFQDACVGAAAELGIPDVFDTYRQAAADGVLTCHVVGALWWDRSRGLGQIDDLLARRERADRDAGGRDTGGRDTGGRDAGARGRFRATTVKLMLDGVCETFTAAMSAPYLGRHGERGRLFIDQDTLREATGRLAAEGFQLHFHAIGDLAVSTALDALEALPAEQRRAGRHHLAHLQFIAPRDMGRFRALDAVANFQPLWACNEPQMEELTLPFVGPERAAWQYLIGSLARSGTRIAFGSDWPISSADPLQEMHVAVNRMLSTRLGEPGSVETTMPLLPEEAITISAATAKQAMKRVEKERTSHHAAVRNHTLKTRVSANAARGRPMSSMHQE